MPFSRPLATRLLAVGAVPAALAWYVSVSFFPLTVVQRRAVDVAAPSGIALLAAVAALAIAALTRPVARGFAAPEGAGGAPLRERAAENALRLPGRVAAVVFACGAAVALVVVQAALGQGLPVDIGVAALAAGAACALLAAMLAYSVAWSAGAGAVARLRCAELEDRGTVRGKVLVVCFGLVGITGLLLGAVAYARYRTDTDRQLVDAAVEAQGHAARLLPTRGAAEAAELVWLASGAPTAVVGADGAVLARAGDGDPLAAPARSDAARPSRGPGVERLAAGWRVERAVGSAALVSYVPDAPLRGRREAFWGAASVLVVALLAAAALLVALAARSLTAPLALLGQAAARVGDGDLTAVPHPVSRDETGQLAAEFRRMVLGLRDLVADVHGATRSVGDGTADVAAAGERVKGGAREERDRVLAVHAAVEAMQGSVATVGRGVTGLAESVHGTAAGVGEMAQAMEEVRRQAAELERRIEGASVDLERLAEAGRRARTQLGALDALAGHAQGTLAAVSASLSGLETVAVGSQLAAAQAAELAEHAGGVVQDNVDGMVALRGAVGDAKRRVTALGRRSDDIDQVLDFISEVAGRTNLLSLNASIIATQAGEHGKAFGVVADQIRELAAQISSSTKSIGEIIRAVRDDVSGTARLIDRGDELATAGVQQAQRSLSALGEIRAATAKGHETAAGIRDAVLAHAHSTRDVSNLVASVAENSHAIAEAIEMVGKSVDAVGAVSRGTQTLADQVNRALEEQSGLGRRQLEGLERIDATLLDISRAIEAHESATRRVREVLAHLGRTAEQHDADVAELSASADRLGGRARALAERVARFKIELQEGQVAPK